MDSESDQWSKLPKHTLMMVAERLDSSTDVLRLRAVCSSWRSSLFHLPPNNNSPLFSVKFPFPIAPNPDLDPRRRGHFTLSERTIFYLEPCNFENPSSPASSSKGWMVSVEESKPGKMRMLDILSKFEFVNRPEISSKVLDLLNFRISEVSKVCTLEFVGNQNDIDVRFDEWKSIDINKVVMSSLVDCAVLTIHTGGKLGYFKLGDKKWSLIDDGHEKTHYEDIVYRKGKFYAVNYTGRVVVIDSSINVKAIESPLLRYGVGYGGLNKYLVESLGDLYLVDRFSHEGQAEDILGANYSDEGEDKVGDPNCFIFFAVYKLEDDKQEWVRVTSLGDRAFFIGDDCCFSVSATLFSGCRGNCIYFAEFDFPTSDDDNPGYGVGMFDLESHSVGPLSSFKRYSQIFWPPPTWLEPKASSKPSPKPYSSGR